MYARFLREAHALTGEHFDDVYFEDGFYIPDATAALDHVLRDYRSDVVTMK